MRSGTLDSMEEEDLRVGSSIKIAQLDSIVDGYLID